MREAGRATLTRSTHEVKRHTWVLARHEEPGPRRSAGPAWPRSIVETTPPLADLLDGTSATRERILLLQQHIGNQRVQRILVDAADRGTRPAARRVEKEPGSKVVAIKEFSQGALSSKHEKPLLQMPNMQDDDAPAVLHGMARDEAVTLQREPQPGVAQDEQHLRSARFASSAKLERCFENKDRLTENDPDTDAVTKVQSALLDLSGITGQIYDLGPSGADGSYGPKTAAAVRKFKADENLGSTQFGDVGPGTMHRLDQLFAGSPVPPSPQPTTQCQDSSVISNEKDPLPAVPEFQPQFVGAAELFEKIKQLQPPGHPLPKKPPLGATQPTFAANPVKISTVPESGSSCLRCVADWDLTAAIAVFVAVGSFSDEPKRFAAFQKDSVSGCPFKPLPELLEVRKLILPEAVALSLTAEREHYNDFVRAFRIAGGRYMANVRRLTAERTPLRGKDVAECTDKVEDFLSQALGVPGFNRFLRDVLHVRLVDQYLTEFVADFMTLYNAPDRDREGGPHLATPFPPSDQKPVFPNIDTDINPFGCKAFARKFTRFSSPGIPGPSSESAIKDINEPPKQSWHQL